MRSKFQIHFNNIFGYFFIPFTKIISEGLHCYLFANNNTYVSSLLLYFVVKTVLNLLEIVDASSFI